MPAPDRPDEPLAPPSDENGAPAAEPPGRPPESDAAAFSGAADPSPAKVLQPSVPAHSPEATQEDPEAPVPPPEGYSPVHEPPAQAAAADPTTGGVPEGASSECESSEDAPLETTSADAPPRPLAGIGEPAPAVVPGAKSPERESLEAAPSTRCLNCNAELPGAYCPSCGQRDQPLRQPVHRYVVESVAEYLGLDGRLWPTLGALLFKPGRLTQAYILGRRQRYVRPLRIYITSSLLFFLILAAIDPVGRVDDGFGEDVLADSTMTAGAYAAVLDSALAAREAGAERQRLRADSLQARSDSLRAAIAANADTAAAALARAEPLEDAAPEAAADALAGAREAREDALDDLDEALEEAQRDARALEASRQAQRERWQREQVGRFPPDSVIVPTDLHTASLLVYASNRGPNFDGPEWLFAGEGARRMRAARTPAERNAAGLQIAREAVGKVPTVIFLLMPVFALLLKVLYVRRGWYYSEHLVFALHVHAFAFVTATAVAVLYWTVPYTGTLDWIAGGFGVWTLGYFLLAQKRVYAQGRIKTLVKAMALGWAYFFVLISGIVLAVFLATALG